MLAGRGRGARSAEHTVIRVRVDADARAHMSIKSDLRQTTLSQYACTARHAVRASALEASSVRSDRPKRKGAGTGGAYERYAKDNERGTEPQWGGSS